jgi:hypothetical protein
LRLMILCQAHRSKGRGRLPLFPVSWAQRDQGRSRGNDRVSTRRRVGALIGGNGYSTSAFIRTFDIRGKCPMPRSIIVAHVLPHAPLHLTQTTRSSFLHRTLLELLYINLQDILVRDQWTNGKV